MTSAIYTIAGLLKSSSVADNNYLNRQCRVLSWRKTPVPPHPYKCVEVELVSGPMRGHRALLTGAKLVAAHSAASGAAGDSEADSAPSRGEATRRQNAPVSSDRSPLDSLFNPSNGD